MKKLTLLLTLFCLPFLLCAQVTGEQVRKLFPDDVDISGDFGSSSDISGYKAIIGAPGDTSNGPGSGAAHIYYKNRDGNGNWGQVKKITPSDGEEGDSFGNSVSISGNYAIVGAFFEDANGERSGSAYVFQKDMGGPDNWGQIKKITASDGAKDDLFGKSVSLYYSYAIIGAHGESSNGVNSGAAYIFYQDQGGDNNWGQIKKLTSSEGFDGELFGNAVSIQSSYAVVGSEYDNPNGIGSGAAYIYGKDEGGSDNWGEIKQISASDGSGADRFGTSVSQSVNYVIVGAEEDDDNGTESGSAYIFHKNQGGKDNWGQIKKITPSDGAAEDYFGNSVSIFGSYAIVGATKDDDNGSESGSAYLFNQDEGGTNNWGLVEKITPEDVDADDLFGHSVSIYNDYAIVGAVDKNVNDRWCGSAYIYGPEMPTITSQPESQNDLCVGNSIQFNVNGTDIDNYQWLVSQDGGTNFSEITDGGTYSGSNTSTLTVNISQDQDQKAYTCKVTNTDYPEPLSNHPKRFYSELALLSTEKEDPVFDIQEKQVYLDDSGQASINPSDIIENVADNCGISDTTISQSSFTCSNTGTTTIEVAITDEAGNCEKQKAELMVKDTVKPVISCPEDKSVVAGQSGKYKMQGEEFDPVGINENCSIANLSNNFNNLATLENAKIATGNYEIIWEIVDVSGNSQTCSFDIEVSEYTDIKSFAEDDAKIYPNPTAGKLHIQSNYNEIEYLTVSTLSGRKLYEKRNTETKETIDMSNLSSGVYLIKLFHKNDISIYKVIKK